MAEKFKVLAASLDNNESKILEELSAVQGGPADLGGYYMFDMEKCESIMRPSKTLNETLESF